MVYQGSKNKFKKTLIPFIQNIIDKNEITTFIDAMCGGCNVIDKIKCDRRIAYDINPYLIALLKYGQQDNVVFPESIDKELWIKCRDTPDEFDPWLVGVAEFFASFNGTGFYKGYQAKSGSRNYYSERLRNFQKQIPQLKDVEFYTTDYKDINYSDSVIYFDPPYKGTSKYDYPKGKFDHKEFWEHMRKLSKQHNIVLISEQEAPEDFESIWKQEASRATSQTKGAKAFKVTEKLFVYKDREWNFEF